jgi:hypothetical protein
MSKLTPEPMTDACPATASNSNTNNNNTYASEDEWAMQIHETLGWLDNSPVTAAVTAPTAVENKASIHHGPSVSRRIKRKKGMPKRPLSAYNIFFQKERVRIYESCSEGRVSFEDLGKTIGQRWKSISDKDRHEYDRLADAEVARYRIERDAYDAIQRKTLECKGDDGSDHEFTALRDPLPSNLLYDVNEPSAPSTGDSNSEAKDSTYYFQPHDPDGQLPPTSLPPGMQVTLRDSDGREQSYKIVYKCYRMTRKDAEAYMARLNAQIESKQIHSL